MQTPFFSVVIPTLDEAKTLPKLLLDLSKQTFTDVDVFIVDGGSKDKTVELASKFAQEYKGITILGCEQKNVSIQRNIGAGLSQGAYLIFLDADVRIPPFYLEGIHYNLMKKQVDAFTTFASPDSTRGDTELIIRIQNIGLEGGAALGIPYALGASLGVRREVFTKVGGFDSNISFMEDMELARRIHKHHFSFAAFKDPTFVMNMRRFRKDGTVKLIVKLIPTFIESILSDKVTGIHKTYPMLGGSYYEVRSKKTFAEFRELERLMKKLVKSRKKKVQEITQQLKDLVSK